MVFIHEIIINVVLSNYVKCFKHFYWQWGCYGFMFFDQSASLTNQSIRHTIGAPPQCQYCTVKDV